jgi:hypothetical protein
MAALWFGATVLPTVRGAAAAGWPAPEGVEGTAVAVAGSGGGAVGGTVAAALLLLSMAGVGEAVVHAWSTATATPDKNTSNA